MEREEDEGGIVTADCESLTIGKADCSKQIIPYEYNYHKHIIVVVDNLLSLLQDFCNPLYVAIIYDTNVLDHF